MKEAGASTNSDRVILRSDKTEPQVANSSLQTNQFKPANHGQVVATTESEAKVDKNQEGSNAESTSDTNRKPGLTKTRSYGTSSWQLRARPTKYSNKDAQEAGETSKSVEGQENPGVNEEAQHNNGTNSSLSLTASTGEDLTSKRKTETKENQKSSRNLTQSKNKDERSANESSEKSEVDVKDQSKSKRKETFKEKVCLNWIRKLNKLETHFNMEPTQKLDEEEAPDFCCNKSCPISENKIPNSPKVMKLAKKVPLRKACFGNNDERWYCLMCLKAHNDSLYCFYCGQIYFMEENDLEDDGKAWIQCDDCNKWVSSYLKTFSTNTTISNL